MSSTLEITFRNVELTLQTCDLELVPDLACISLTYKLGFQNQLYFLKKSLFEILGLKT
jgi:hypothetical protein